MAPRINPNLLTAGRAKFVSPGGKFYRPAMIHQGSRKLSRRAFKRAWEAQTYGGRVLARWKKIYNWKPKPKVSWWRRLLNVLLSPITKLWATRIQKTS